MKIIKSKELLKKYIPTISEYINIEGIEFELISYERHELLIQPAFYCHFIYFLVKGRVNVYSLREDGRQFIMEADKRVPMLGDIEFMNQKYPELFVEALEEVLVLRVNTQVYGNRLHNDVLFLHSIIYSCMDILQSTHHNQTLEEKVLGYMKYQCEDQKLRKIERSAEILHCSRRQLQRVLSKLVNEKKIIKVSKGVYCLNNC